MSKILILYSGLLLVGGFIGYILAGSVASLLMSGIFAFLLLLSIYFQKTSATYLLLSFLSLFFIYRTVHTGKFMPSGILALLTLAVLTSLFLTDKQP